MDDNPLEPETFDPSPESYEFDRAFEKRVSELEKETDERVSQALSSIETAISSWNTMKRKPPALTSAVEAMKRFRKAISEWEKKSLRARGRNLSLDERMDLLREFSEICEDFEGAW